MVKLRGLCAAAVIVCSATLASAGEDNRVYIAHLMGGNELPALGDLDAFGVATLTFATPAVVCYTIVLQNAVAPTAAHIHSGGAGSAGAVALALPLPAAPLPTRFANCIAAPAALVTAVRNAPFNFYVNVHNAAFPGGAVRGQLQ